MFYIVLNMKMDFNRLLTSEGSVTMIAILVSILNLFGWPGSGHPLMMVFLVIKLAVIWMMIQDGTLLKSKVYTVLLFLYVPILAVGSLFKINHWPFSDVLLLLGFSAILIFYTVRFILKKQKQFFDILKWCWVTLTCVGAPFKIFHWPYGGVLWLVAMLLLFILMCYYLYEILTTVDDAGTME
ncbi:MAG: hypothetical protein JWO03_2672 [Bacteroidetes bacterium]|nr:hypothetical protein [Bacteroidota bacterium]